MKCLEFWYLNVRWAKFCFIGAQKRPKTKARLGEWKRYGGTECSSLVGTECGSAPSSGSICKAKNE